MRQLEQQVLTPHESECIAAMVLNLPFKDLLPVAWKMLETKPTLFPVSRLIDHIYNITSPSVELNDRFVKLACGTDWDVKQALFRYWKKCPAVALAESHLRALASQGSLWTNILAYTTIPDRLSEAAKKALVAKLRDFTAPIPASKFRELLQSLDNDEFAIREQATADLEMFGEHVSRQLRNALKDPLSLEAKWRVESILDNIGKTKPSRECVHALDYLESCYCREAITILETFAASPSDTWIVRRAKDILAKRKSSARGADTKNSTP